MKVSGTLLFTLIFSGFSALHCWATVYHSNGTPASVQALHNAAQTGDTITLPVGTFTWSTPVSFTKAVNVQGSGTGQTVIYDNVPKTGGGNSMILWTFNVAAGTSIRVTGFTVHGMAQDTHNYNKGTLAFSGGSHAVRVDHVNVILGGSSAIHFGGDLWGVVDHCYFDGSNFKQSVSIDHGNWNGDTAGWGDGSYEDTLHLGTERAIYIEDCTFVNQTTAGVVDGTRGGRFVFRHNTVQNAYVGMHGTEGFRGRGMRSYEIYNNTFLNPNAIIFTGLYLRSGTGVIFNNTFSGGAGQTGYKNGMMFTVYRNSSCGGVNEGPPWGNANGTNPWDGNTLANGYPALDQVGHGTCQDQIRGNNPVNMRTGTPAWPTQALEPVYEWNNSWTRVPQNPGNKVTTQCDIVQIGRDVFTDTPKPGYTPYVYPHPLVIGPRAVIADFNGDGSPDFQLRRNGTGLSAIWYLNNNVLTDGDPGPTLPMTWTLTGAADFNGDGHTDYALVHPATNYTAIWYMSGPTLIGAAWGPRLPSGWELVGAADFNGDSKPDYVLYNASTHQTAIWYLNNNVLIGGAWGPTLPNGWSLVGVADFDRDGHTDYALFKATTGETAIWYLSGPTLIGGAVGPTVPSGWRLVATADFDRDGNPDFLLYNASSYETAIWYLNNNVFVSSASGPTLLAAWGWRAP
jgi:FG-GAP-like repeat